MYKKYRPTLLASLKRQRHKNALHTIPSLIKINDPSLLGRFLNSLNTLIILLFGWFSTALMRFSPYTPVLRMYNYSVHLNVGQYCFMTL